MSADGSPPAKTGLARLLEIAAEARRIQTPLHERDLAPVLLECVAGEGLTGIAKSDAMELRAKARSEELDARHPTEGAYYTAMAVLLREAADILEAGDA